MKKLYNLFSYLLFSIASLVLLGLVSTKMWIPLESSDYATLLIYLILLVFINSFPLVIGEIYVTFMFAVSVSVFLQYGIVVETWLTQVAILVSLLVSAQKRTITRIILSQMMFIWVSILSGFAYFLVGGKLGFSFFDVKGEVLPIAVYAISYFVVNHILVYILVIHLNRQKAELFSDDAAWDAATLLLTIPLGVIMYLVQISFGNYGIVFVALPILIVTQMFKIYNELHHSHRQLKALNKLSASFTSELNLEKTINSLQNALRDLFVYDYSYILLANGEKLTPFSIENYQGKPIEQEMMGSFNMMLGEGLSGRVALLKKAQIVDSDADLYQLSNEPDFTRNNKSLLSVPMVWHNQAIGVITLGSADDYNFSKKDLTIAKILASQAAVAIQNAATYKKTEEKNLLDELTGVYNFRAFNDLLNEKVFETELKDENLGLLFIDLDHFKKVNDKYGHHAGNEVLKQISKILKKMTRQEDIIARYGGEEFLVIIPNSDVERTKIIAERIRLAIEETPINVKGTLLSPDEVAVRVTASIGLAVYPESADSAQDLIRNADRAMYIGSKQAGRNKVAVY